MVLSGCHSATSQSNLKQDNIFKKYIHNRVKLDQLPYNLNYNCPWRSIEQLQSYFRSAVRMQFYAHLFDKYFFDSFHKGQQVQLHVYVQVVHHFLMKCNYITKGEERLIRKPSYMYLVTSIFQDVPTKILMGMLTADMHTSPLKVSLIMLLRFIYWYFLYLFIKNST